MSIGPLFAALAAAAPSVEPVVETVVVEALTLLARPHGVREVDAPCGCRLRLSRCWLAGELATTVKACEVKAAGKSCGAVRGVWFSP